MITSPTEGMLTRDTTPQITGTGEAGATVAVSIDAVMVGTTTAAEDGSWTFLPPTPLATGAHTVSASQSDAAGNDSPSSAPVGFVVDGTVPAAPVILQPVDGTVTTQTRPQISGTGEPGARLTVRDGNLALTLATSSARRTASEVGSVLVAADGTWTLIPSTALSPGLHTFSATQADPAGNSSPVSNLVRITVTSAQPSTSSATTGPSSTSSSTTSGSTTGPSTTSGSSTAGPSASPTRNNGGGVGSLARTGAEVGLLLAIGAVLVLTGLALTRRRCQP